MSAVLSSTSGQECRDDRLLSPKEVAGVLGMSLETVYRLIKSEALPTKKLGHARRMWRSDLDTWINAH